MTTLNRRLSLDEVLDEFFYSADKPTPVQVLRACEAHPEYRDDIVEFAALWTAYEASPEPIEDASLPKVTTDDVSRLHSYVLNRIHELDGKAAQSTDLEATKRAISTLAGGKLGRAATAAGFASSLLMTKVLTTITNVPPRVIRDLAKHLHVAPADLRQCIGPQFAGARNYSSNRQPDAPGLETWESAVRSLPESEDEKKRLLGFQTEDNAS
ncbi:hypothetical protein FFI97_019570 [Variovorax sp. KBS0712]|uniref:hypothetical protein n=1 Tax=Variovorax sp. KBS0712 TaxID=2578111 RepID=UPI0011194F75|nr:hypothetical protein [Variovorax sp. KBS0712]TSD56431.1 hypothetical protein FFI97_019570 [Variovorax sp. KBS0712]